MDFWNLTTHFLCDEIVANENNCLLQISMYKLLAIETQGRHNSEELQMKQIANQHHKSDYLNILKRSNGRNTTSSESCHALSNGKSIIIIKYDDL